MIEYRVRPITRFVVTRFEKQNEENGMCGECSTLGEYDNADVAYEVGYAIAKAEQDKLGLPLGSSDLIYPKRVEPQMGTLAK